MAADASETVATRLIARIDGACEPLRHFPLSGPARDWLAPGLRVTFEGRYAIYYAHDERTLTIVRVLHGIRDVATVAQRGGFG